MDASETKPTDEKQAVLFHFHTTMVVEILTSATRSGYIDLIYAPKNKKVALGLNVSVLITFDNPNLTNDLLSDWLQVN